jgi:hypothetical protein
MERKKFDVGNMVSSVDCRSSVGRFNVIRSQLSVDNDGVTMISHRGGDANNYTSMPGNLGNELALP